MKLHDPYLANMRQNSCYKINHVRTLIGHKKLLGSFIFPNYVGVTQTNPRLFSPFSYASRDKLPLKLSLALSVG